MKYLYIGCMLIAIIMGLKNQTHYNIKPVLSDLERHIKDTQHKITKQLAEDNFNKASQWEQIVLTAKKAAKQEDYPVGELLARIALESAHGTSYLAIDRNNYCGLNAVDWNPDLAYSYKSMEEGVLACINVIKNHYQSAYAKRHDPVEMITEIKRLGYATDSNYVSKVINMKEFRENQ